MPSSSSNNIANNKSLRTRVAELLEVRHDTDKLSKFFDLFLVSLILLNVLAVVIGTVESVANEYHAVFHYFEIISVIVFSLEYLARVWVSVEIQDSTQPAWKVRLKHMLSPMAIVDLLAILPFYLSLFIDVDLRVLRMFRLMRVAKLGRYSASWQTLMQVFKQEFWILSAAILLLLILMLMAATGIYYLEREHQPEAFGSIPHALWWSMVTLTTVGYGDVTPITAGGKFFAGAITIMSMGMVALPAGILASSFNEQLRRNRYVYRAKINDVLEDGVVTSSELADLEHLRIELGLSKEDAQQLFERFQQAKPKVAQVCPHCGKTI